LPRIVCCFSTTHTHTHAHAHRSGPKNMFTALETSDVRPPRPTPPSVKADKAPKHSQDEIDNKVAGCLEEFLSVRDVNEVELTLKDLGMNLACETLVRKLLETVAESSSEVHRQALASLLRDLVKNKAVSDADLKNGLVASLAFLPLPCLGCFNDDFPC
jgi:hypothetical protein